MSLAENGHGRRRGGEVKEEEKSYDLLVAMNR